MAAGSTLGPANSVLLPGKSGDSLLAAAPSIPILAGPPGVELSPEVHDRTGTFSAFVARDASSALPVLRLQSGGIFVFPPIAGLRQIALTRSGGALLDGSRLRYVAPGVDVLLGQSGAQRFVLSGAL